MGESVFVKMTILLKQSTYFSAIPVKTAMAFITGLEQITPEFVWKQKRPKRAKAILRKKEKQKTRVVTVPDSKLYYKTTVIKAV